MLAKLTTVVILTNIYDQHFQKFIFANKSKNLKVEISQGNIFLYEKAARKLLLKLIPRRGSFS